MSPVHYAPSVLASSLPRPARLPTPLSDLPIIADRPGHLVEVLVRDAVLDALEHRADGADVVSLVLVVAEPDDAPAAQVVEVALDDAVVERVVEPLERLPFLLGDVHVVEVLVLVAVVAAVAVPPLKTNSSDLGTLS